MDQYADALGIAAPAKAPVSGKMDSRAFVGGRDDLVNTLGNLQSVLADAKEGSALHQRTATDIQRVQEELTRMGGAVATPVVAAPKADPYADALGIGGPAQNAAPAVVAPASTGLHQTTAQITSPEADVTAHAVSSLVAPIVGGYSGIVGGIVGGAKKLYQGGSLGEAGDAAASTGADVSQRVVNALTYEPRTERGQQMGEQWDSGYNPLGWIPSATQWAGNKLGDFLANHGEPGLGAISRGAGAAAPAALGLRRLGSLVKPGEVPPAPRIEPTMDGPSAIPAKPRYRLENGQPVLVPQPMPQGAPVPAGAAANAPVAASVAPTRPTITQASPELQSAVANAKASGQPVNQAVLARHVDAESLPVPIKLTEGQALMDPEKISMEMNSRGKQAPPVSPDFYNAQGKALASNMDAIRAKVAPNITATHPTEIGQILVDEYKAMDAPVRAAIDAKYQALRDANGGEFPVDAAALKSNIEAALKKELLSHDAPASQMAEIAQLADEGGMTFEHFLSLRRNLGNIARTAQDGNTRTAASIMVRQLEELPMQPGAANLKPLADAARAAARSRFQRMDSDPAYKAAANDSVAAGEPSPLADKFVQGYIINGKGANVKQMKANLANSPTANEAIAASGVDYLARMAKADKETGKFLADQYGNGVRQLSPKLNDIFDPATAETVRQIGRVSKYTAAQPKGSYVNNSNSATAYLAEKAKDAAEVGVNMKAGGIPIGTLARKIVQNRAASKAAKQSVAPGAGITSPQK